MHPLLPHMRLHGCAPILYDVLYIPSTRTVVDRTTHTAHTRAQPATEPPAPRVVLRSDKSSSLGVAGGPRPSPPGRGSTLGVGRKRAVVIARSSRTSTCSTPYTRPSSHASPRRSGRRWATARAQKKVTQAYEKRCKRMGGGWDGGVRRVIGCMAGRGWLGSRLIGMVGIVGRTSWSLHEPDLIRPGHSRIRSNMAIVIRFIQQKHRTLLAS